MTKEMDKFVMPRNSSDLELLLDTVQLLPGFDE